jgi:YVTN family beta-propeller protein
MKHNYRPVAVLIVVCLLTSGALGVESVRIDDTTLLDPASGRALTACEQEAPSVAPSPGTGAPAAMRSRALTDGFAGCSTSDNCAPFDLVSYVPGAAISLLPEGDYPYDATLNPAGTELWIPGAAGDGVIVIDRATNTISHRIGVGEYPVSVAFSNDWSLALVACRDTEELTIIDTATYAVTGSLPIPTTYLGAGNIALDPVSGNFYLVDWYGDDLYEIAPDGSSILRQVTIGSSLWQLVVAPDGETIYVTDRGTDEVRVIDRTTLTQIDSYSVGDDPWGIDVTADGSKLVVTCEDSHNVYVIDTLPTKTDVIALDPDADPRDVDILDSAQYAYVAGGRTTGNPVYVIELVHNTLKDTFEANGTNVNVIAVQAQRTQSGTGVDELAGADGHTGLVAHPNPFHPTTHITYSLVRASAVRLVVYDIAGRTVCRLVDGWREAGAHETSWDGRDDRGGDAAAGVYFLRFDAGEEGSTQRLVLLR